MTETNSSEDDLSNLRKRIKKQVHTGAKKSTRAMLSGDSGRAVRELSAHQEAEEIQNNENDKIALKNAGLL